MMTNEQREALKELIWAYGHACEKFGEEVTNYWAEKTEVCWQNIEELLDKIQNL